MNFLHVYNVNLVRLKLAALYCLNVSDALITYFLVQTGYFYEINFLLKDMVPHAGKFFITKGLLPIMLISWLYFRVRDASERQLKYANIAVNSLLFLYMGVNILHLFWVTLFMIIM